MTTCIIIPAYNEEHAIAETICDYKKTFPKARVVVIDNNSTDATVMKAREFLDPHKDALLVEKRQGKGYAVKSALSRYIADIYILTDGDATYPAKNALNLFLELLKTRADMIVGDRLSDGAYHKQNTRVGHGWGNNVMSSLISYFAGHAYNDVFSGLRVMSRAFVSKLDVRSSGFQLETELNITAAYLNADVIEIPIQYCQRGHGSFSKLNTVRDGIKILGFAITNWISFKPLHPFLILTFFMSVISGLLSYRVVNGFLETGLPYTTSAVAAVSCGMIGVLALFFGLALQITNRNFRRREISSFLEAKRIWNAALDQSQV